MLKKKCFPGKLKYKQSTLQLLQILLLLCRYMVCSLCRLAGYQLAKMGVPTTMTTA